MSINISALTSAILLHYERVLCYIHNIQSLGKSNLRHNLSIHHQFPALCWVFIRFHKIFCFHQSKKYSSAFFLNVSSLNGNIMWEIEVENRHDKLDELLTSIDWVYWEYAMDEARAKIEIEHKIFMIVSMSETNHSEFEFIQSINFSIFNFMWKKFPYFVSPWSFWHFRFHLNPTFFTPILYVVVAEVTKFPSLPSVSYNLLRSERMWIVCEIWTIFQVWDNRYT